MTSSVHPSGFHWCERVVTCTKSLPSNKDKFIGCRNWSPRGFIRTNQSIKAHMNNSWSESKASHIVPGWKEEAASVSGGDTNAGCSEVVF